MNDPRNIIGTTPAVRYALEVWVCGNNETIFDGAEDPGGNGWNDEAREVCGEVIAALLKQGLDYDLESNFSDWHGGKFSNQSAMHNIVVDGIVAHKWLCGVVDNDEYGDEMSIEWESIKESEVPEDSRAKIVPFLEQINQDAQDMIQKIIEKQA